MRKMNMKALRIGGIAILLAAAVAYAADGVVLKYVYKKDAVSKTRLKGNMNFSGSTVTVNMVNQSKVKEIDADGNITVEDGILEGTVTANGTEFPLGNQPANVIIMSPNGEIKQIKGDNIGPEAYRMQNLMAFIPPAEAVQVGSKWKRELATNKDTKAPALKSDYSITGEEKVDGTDTFKVDYKSSETEGDTPATISGTFWISKEDCSLVKGTAKWDNVPEPTTKAIISGEVTLERVK